MAESNRINIKLPNGASFEAEADADLVRELWAEFLAEQKASAPIEHPAGRPLPAHLQATTGVTEPPMPLMHAPDSMAGVKPPEPDTRLIERLFTADRLGTVSLRALPRTQNRDADALVLLLYGFQKLRGQHDVTSGRLMKGARQSGIQAVRIDRLLAGQSDYVTSAGFKKGRRYGLNNPGVRRAEELLKEILG